jgi:hypothetical protein
MKKAWPDHTGKPAFGVATLVMLACCGSHLLAFGVIGGLAAGSVFGVVAGVLAASGLVTVLLSVRRHRAAAAREVPSSCPPTRKAVPHER